MPRLLTTRLAHVFVLGLVVFVPGCLVGPDYERPDTSELVPREFKHDTYWKEAEPRDDAPRGVWWEVFGDERLNTLVNEASTNQPGVRAAYHRVEQARAVVRASGSAFYPDVTFEGSAQRSRRSGTSGSNQNDLRGRTTTVLRFPLTMTYEIDLWGRLRRALEAAVAEAEALEAERHNVLLALQSDVCANYFLMAGLDAEIVVLEEGVTVRQKNFDLMQKRYEAGDVDALDLRRAETELAATQSELLDLRRRRDLAENALAVLTGNPSSNFDMAEPFLPVAPPIVPPALPAQLLERRPDVAAAERRMAVENARIGQAQAAWFPDVRLNGSIGFESSELDDLFRWPSRVWGFGPTVDIPILEGGRIKADVDRSWQRYFESVELYRQQVLEAIREVDDAVGDLHWLERQAEAQERTVDAARTTVALAQRRYDAGLVSYFDVVDAQRAELQNRQLAVRIQSARMLAAVQLIKALGGGWGGDEGEEAGEARLRPD